MIELQTGILWAKTYHRRYEPVERGFSYPLLMLCLDVAELPISKSRLFSYNRSALFSVWDRDYLRNRSGAIDQKVRELLRESGLQTPPAKTFLLTTPRFAGYVFNPVNFYVSTNESKQLHSIVAEVSNTFGEVHTYVMRGAEGQSQNGRTTFAFPKEFYVSPFLDLTGFYGVSLAVSEGKMEIHIDLQQHQKTVLSAALTGRLRPLTDRMLCLSLACFPLSCVLTMSRIQWQAWRLAVLRRIKIYQKPAPRHRHTFVYAASWMYRWRMGFLAVFMKDRGGVKT